MFSAFRERLTAYCSPFQAKSQRNPLKTRLKQDRRSVSPSERLENAKKWVSKSALSPSTAAKPNKIHKVKGARVSKKSNNIKTPTKNKCLTFNGANTKSAGNRKSPQSYTDDTDITLVHEDDDEEAVDSAQVSPGSNWSRRFEDDNTMVVDETVGGKGSNTEQEIAEDVSPSSVYNTGDLEKEQSDIQRLNAERALAEREKKAAAGSGYKECTDDMKALSHKLNMRGFEALVPNTWRLDFTTIPTRMFAKDDRKAFIKPAYGSQFRAAKALINLFALGARTRDRALLTRLSPEVTLAKEINAYIKWSIEDGDLIDRDYIPILVTASARKEESVDHIVDRITKKMHKAGAQYRDLWRIDEPIPISTTTTTTETKARTTPTTPPPKKGKSLMSFLDFYSAIQQPQMAEIPSTSTIQHPPSPDPLSIPYAHPLPTIYGLVYYSTVVSVVSYDARIPNKAIRSFALFDFGDEKQDVWNAIAIAILCVWVRNWCMGLDAERVERGDESDPDA